MREASTDERLDELTLRVEHGFERVDERFERIDERFERVDERLDRVDERFERVEADIRELRVEMNARFDSMQRTMIIGFASIVASVIATQA